jgi:transcriptional regulator with XRE-family HTH domain
MNEQEFGAKIKARREELGLSQKDLAVALDLDQGKVSLIERGARKVDGVKELPLLAKVLKKPLSWFYEDDELDTDKDPLKALLKDYLPNLEFSDFEVRQMKKILEPVVSSFVTSYVDAVRDHKQTQEG